MCPQHSARRVRRTGRKYDPRSVEVWDGRRGITNKCIIRWEFLARAFSSVFSTVFRSEFGRYLVAVGSRIGRKVENSGRNLGKSATPGCTLLHFFGFQLWVPPGEKRQKSRKLANLAARSRDLTTTRHVFTVI